jgi:hypothetical protein
MGDVNGSAVRVPNTGGYAFPYSYKPAKAAKTHVANENFNPDFFIKLSSGNDILVVGAGGSVWVRWGFGAALSRAAP